MKIEIGNVCILYICKGLGKNHLLKSFCLHWQHWRMFWASHFFQKKKCKRWIFVILGTCWLQKCGICWPKKKLTKFWFQGKILSKWKHFSKPKFPAEHKGKKNTKTAKVGELCQIFAKIGRKWIIDAKKQLCPPILPWEPFLEWSGLVAIFKLHAEKCEKWKRMLTKRQKNYEIAEKLQKIAEIAGNCESCEKMCCECELPFDSMRL